MNSANEFERLYRAVCALEAAAFSAPAALATITRTTGSTFRHAGASMLVAADGTVVCALSGGCPQRDIVQRALRVIASGAPELAAYNRDSSLDVLIEMGCGGEIEVLIEPLRGRADTAFLHALATLHARREAGGMATAFARDGAAVLPRPRRLVRGNEVLWNDLDDAALSERALALLRQMPPAAACVQSGADAADLLLESLLPQQQLLLVGANDISLALCALAATLGWKCMVVDNAPAPAGADGVPVLALAPQQIAGSIACDAASAAVVMTFNIERDLAWLAELARLPLGYLGAVGSRARSARMRDAAARAGARLHAPAGLDVGAQTPGEIAVAIAAEIMARRGARAGTSLSMDAAAT